MFLSRCPFLSYVLQYRYLGPSDWSTNGAERTLTYQGGYYCSVRAWTAFENEDYVMDAPNFWSRYMDTKVQCSGSLGGVYSAHCNHAGRGQWAQMSWGWPRKC